MVLYFSSSTVDPAAVIFMGKDKFENEDLIKYTGTDDVIWFHVDRLSSAHVYLRLPLDCKDWTEIDEKLLLDCGQLVKANSIEGNKKNNINIVYTPSSNLLKRKGMETGQVSFKKEKLVKRFLVISRENSIVNRLNKTKVEKTVEEFKQEQLDMRRQSMNEEKAIMIRRKQEEMERQRQLKREEEERSYNNVFKKSDMIANEDISQKYQNEETGEIDINSYEDDFM